MRSRSTRDTSLGLRKVDAIGANHSRSRYGRAANGTSAGLLCEEAPEAPETPVLRSRELKIFGPIEAAHLRLLPGEVETPPFKGHLVNVHLGAPHRLVQRRNERTHEGLKATGAVDIVTAGMPAYWCMAAASEHIGMLLEDRFIQKVAAEAGADPDKTEIVPFFSAPDLQIERIGLSLLSEMETGSLGGELYAESLANVLALHLLRHHSSLRLQPAGLRDAADTLDPSTTALVFLHVTFGEAGEYPLGCSTGYRCRPKPHRPINSRSPRR